MSLPAAAPPPPGLPASSAPSPHRLPTVSATQALRDHRENLPRPISTGHLRLDQLLSEDHAGLTSHTTAHGLSSGSVVELWGPSGSGKTTLALQLAASTLARSQTVIWAAVSRPLVRQRLPLLLPRGTVETASQEPTQHFHYRSVPSLSHLLVLLLRPPSSVPLVKATLLVIDDLHLALDVAYPRTTASYSSSTTEAAKWASTRRHAALASIMAVLRRLAATSGLITVITSGAATRSRGAVGGGAVLVPGVSGAEWERGVSVRMVMFRDFGGRFMGITKLGGRTIVQEDGDVGIVLAFGIEESGVVDTSTPPRNGGDTQQAEDDDAVLPVRIASPVKKPARAAKRKHEQLEVGDSEDDEASEYGWDEGDEVAAEGLIEGEEDDDVVLMR